MTVRAPGKVNLHLAVGSRRHRLSRGSTTVLQAVSLFDELTATGPRHRHDHAHDRRGGRQGFRWTRATLPSAPPACWPSAPAPKPGCSWSCASRSPSLRGWRAGAHAAAALVACEALWGTDLSRGDWSPLAELGSDVPFSLAGGTALGTGAARSCRRCFPAGPTTGSSRSRTGASTPAVYAELDRYREELPRPAAVAFGTLQPCGRGVTALGHRWPTTLKGPAIRLRPGLRRVLDAGRELGALGALVSGSGPTCAFLTADRRGCGLAARLAGQGVCRLVRCAHGPVPGARVDSMSGVTTDLARGAGGTSRRPAEPDQASARRSPSRASRTAWISRALLSIWPRSTPWRALVGSA